MLFITQNNYYSTDFKAFEGTPFGNKKSLDWEKDLPHKLIVIDKHDVEHECELHLVGYSWFGNEIGLEYPICIK